MNNIDQKVKKWIALIQREELAGLTAEIQVYMPANTSEWLNRQIFNLLLYLSHTAEKCDRQNYSLGKEIHRLTRLLYSLLKEVLDSYKFGSSLFHIVRCLLAMRMHSEASEVSSYLKAVGSPYPRASVSEVLEKTSSLWYNCVSNTFLVLQKDPFGSKHYHELKDVIKSELEMVRIAHESPTKELLTKISSYLDKIASITRTSYIEDFYAFAIGYLRPLKLRFESRHAVTHYVLLITARIMHEATKRRLKLTEWNSLSDYFKGLLRKDEECYQCFQHFEALCLVLVKPVYTLAKYDAESVRAWGDDYTRIAKKYGYTGLVKSTQYSIVQVLEGVFTYWESWANVGEKKLVETGLLVETMNVVALVGDCFDLLTSDKCKSCRSADCTMRRDMYSGAAIKVRCMTVISKLPAEDLSKDIRRLARVFMEQNVKHTCRIKEHGCESWKYLWASTGTLIYNLAVTTEDYYDESVYLYSLLFTSILQFEGVKSQTRYIRLENVLGIALHRMSTLHYTNGMYREAMTACALNALLSYDDPESKAFCMWANIKHMARSSREVMEMTMLACLRADKAKIEELGLSFELSQYDLVEICLREAEGLQKAKVNLSTAIRRVLDDMVGLIAPPATYARAVQMLAYHLLHFDHDEDCSYYLELALRNLKRAGASDSALCLRANLEFYVFVNQVHVMNRKTEMEMKNTKFALYAPRLPEMGETEDCDVVPTYSMINIKQDSRLMGYLQAPLKIWNECFNRDIGKVAKGYEPMITLRALIIAGEYAHLNRYQECEANIWRLAYKLASELKDNCAIIYVTGRSISLRCIDPERITIAKDLAVTLKYTSDEDLIGAIAVFWISLSDFYFERSMHDEARTLLDESRKLSTISIFSNISVHLYSLDRIVYNCYAYREDIKHEEYIRYIVEALYGILQLNEDQSTRKWKPQDKHLFGFSVLLSATVNLSQRMNSLLSFREISAHLVRRLKTAQALGATMRVVEILKTLCYMDLSRSKLGDCEVKLQGLEYILNTETLKASMSNPSKAAPENYLITPMRVVDPLRDVPQNDASPVLGNKVFGLPEFMRHGDCHCYACGNVSYQYLVFASTHIRAQLYALQNKFTASLEHFHGAFIIKESLTKEEAKGKAEWLSWQERLYSLDYVLLLINFAYFLRSHWSTKHDKVVNIILLATEMCNVYKLKGHPIYMSIKELMLDGRFQALSVDYSKFTVPDASDIDVAKYAQEIKAEDSICVTPTTSNPRAKKPISLRRNRTPPLLKLTKVSLVYGDEAENNSSPPRYKRTRQRDKLTRRKILDEEYSEGSCKKEEETEQAGSKPFLEEFVELRRRNFENVTMNDIVDRIALLVPDSAEQLRKIARTVDEPVTNKSIERFIKTVENLTVNASSQKSVRQTRQMSKQLASSDHGKINEVIALFKDLAVDE